MVLFVDKLKKEIERIRHITLTDKFLCKEQEPLIRDVFLKSRVSLTAKMSNGDYSKQLTDI